MPLEAYEASALFQMKFYALVIWRLRGVIPRVLQLMYLSGDGEVLRYSPDEADLRATERKLERAVGRDLPGAGDRRLAAAAVAAVRLVPAQGAVPGVRRDAAAAARGRATRGTRRALRLSRPAARAVRGWRWRRPACVPAAIRWGGTGACSAACLAARDCGDLRNSFDSLRLVS